MKLVLNTDGGARGNPGPSACGAVIRNEAGEIIKEMGTYLGIATNNVAEYEGLILGLSACIEKNATHVQVKMDSELIVKQLRGEYKVKNETLISLYKKTKELESKIGNVEYTHVRREFNKDADKLVNEVLDSTMK